MKFIKKIETFRAKLVCIMKAIFLMTILFKKPLFLYCYYYFVKLIIRLGLKIHIITNNIVKK